MQFIDLATQQARIRPEFERRLRRVLEHGRYILGPEVEELEQRLADYVGVRHAITVGSGTEALIIALMALGIGPGDEVITTPFTFAATAEAPRLLGATVRFADVEPDTLNLDARAVAARITPRTRAIIAVDLYGQCADYAALAPLAARQGLALVADAAQSFGATAHGRRAGSFGDVAATSFYPSKPLGAYGEGGALFTQDDGLALALRQIRVHGQSGTHEHVRLGLNGRLDTLQCAVLLAKLEVFDDELARRQQVAAAYDAQLPAALRRPTLRSGHSSSWAQYTVRSPARDALRASLAQAGVPTHVHYPHPLHRQAPFADPAAQVPVAEQAAREVLSLPMHPYLRPTELDQVAQAMRAALGAAR